MKDKEINKMLSHLNHCGFCGPEKKRDFALVVGKGYFQITCRCCHTIGPIAGCEKTAGKYWNKLNK